jgi:hypothetical protein
LTIFVGDDWAEDHHDIHLIATDGAHLAMRRLPEGLAGIRAFRELVAKLAEAESARRLGPQPDGGPGLAARPLSSHRTPYVIASLLDPLRRCVIRGGMPQATAYSCKSKFGSRCRDVENHLVVEVAGVGDG